MVPAGPGPVFTQAGDYDWTEGKEVSCIPKKRRIGTNEGTNIRPRPVDLIPRSYLSLGAHGARPNLG